MTIKNLKLSILSFVIIAVAAIIAMAAIYKIKKATPVVVQDNSQVPVVSARPNSLTPPSSSSNPSPNPATPNPATTGTKPAMLNLPIPFTPQAPTGNWDLLHNEACEEASAIMANAYLTGDKDVVMPATQVEKEISNLTAWQDKNFGYHLDTTATETAQMIQSVYGLKATVQEGYSLQDIKDALNLHHVVILPVNGQDVGNPNYKQPGPIYHMLVIRGYSGSTLITDDSGTKRGENYPYAFSTLHNAGADWDHSINTIDQSKKVMIVVSK